MPKLGSIANLGLELEIIKNKEFLENFGTEYTIISSGSFKSSLLPFSDELNNEDKAKLSQLINSLHNQVIQDIKMSRQLDEEKIKNDTGYSSPNFLGGGNTSDKEWAAKVMEGGYILHFRHAERDKWIDVQMYDALESDVHDNGPNESRYAAEANPAALAKPTSDESNPPSKLNIYPPSN